MTVSSSQCPEQKLLLFDKEKFYSIKQRLLQENSWLQKRTSEEKKNYKDQRESIFLRGRDE